MDKKELSPFCTSYKCTSANKGKQRVKLDVAPKTRDCPNCGSAILWRPEGRRHMYTAVNNLHKSKGLDAFPV